LKTIPFQQKIQAGLESAFLPEIKSRFVFFASKPASRKDSGKTVHFFRPFLKSA
jgi:hypothetical protein